MIKIVYSTLLCCTKTDSCIINPFRGKATYM